MRFLAIPLFWLLAQVFSYAQGTTTIQVNLDAEKDILSIEQEINYVNSSSEILTEIQLIDWANSFSEKTTPLAQRFAENFENQFHFEKREDRGRTIIQSFLLNNSPVTWQRGDEIDIIKVPLDTPLIPNASVSLTIKYLIKLPDEKFTRYGVTNDKEYYLKYWQLMPAEYIDKKGWQSYSHKNIDDYYVKPLDVTINTQYTDNYTLFSDLNTSEIFVENGVKKQQLNGDKRRILPLNFVKGKNKFDVIDTDVVRVVTNLKDNKVNPAVSALFIDRITHYLKDNLGDYPFPTLISTVQDYKNNPVYGLNQLPDFINPFPNGFEYEMEQLKNITGVYINNNFRFNNREEYWLKEAIHIKLIKDYVDTYYPDMKLIGSLSDFFVVRWSHASDVAFNDQYPLLYLQMARNNLHQSLVTPKDSLVKFNKEIASGYYAGQGLSYLEEYLGDEIVSKTISEFFENNTLQPVTINDFRNLLAQKTNKPIDWFFEEYAGKRSLIDFKIKKVKKQEDSLLVTIRSKHHNKLPVSISGINNDKVIVKKWIPPFANDTIISFPKENVKKLAVNYNEVIPEFNDRNNIKNLNGILNRPIQLRVFQDIQDNNFNQAFFMPIYGYNLYDGLTTGLKLYNKTLLPKQLHYKLQPQYGFTSKTIVGSGSVIYNDLFNENNPYRLRVGVSGNYFSYNTGLFYKRLTPFMTFSFRNDDLRNNEKQFINLRSITVERDEDPLITTNQNPNYSVFNASYVYSNPNLINFYRGVVDYQISSKFSKLSATFTYRKLFLNNRQINLRAFAGVFLFNDTQTDDDFFSFALDRPTDYLFDYDYYGRSEDAGLFSQQLIIAEGGFKSQLQPAFANRWITTLNADTNIWKWIFAYGDVGLVNNSERGTKAVFDSGIRVSLVQDYFELYFPLYSNLGWEPGLPNYDQRIRFIVTLSPKTLLGLFTRKWY